MCPHSEETANFGAIERYVNSDYLDFATWLTIHYRLWIILRREPEFAARTLAGGSAARRSQFVRQTATPSAEYEEPQYLG